MPPSLLASVGSWRCPICQCDSYHRVKVTRPSGKPYEAPFFACSQCSVMFTNPGRFSSAPQVGQHGGPVRADEPT